MLGDQAAHQMNVFKNCQHRRSTSAAMSAVATVAIRSLPQGYENPGQQEHAECEASEQPEQDVFRQGHDDGRPIGG